MHNLKIPVGNRYVTRLLPADWNELTARQLIWYCRIVSIKLDADAKLRSLMYRFLKLPIWNFQRIKTHHFFTMAETLNWLWEKDVTLTRFLVKKIRVGLTTYYSPGDNLKHSTVEEVANADTWFKKYIEMSSQAAEQPTSPPTPLQGERGEIQMNESPEGDSSANSTEADEALCIMIAILYRPTNVYRRVTNWLYGSDIRVKYNEHNALKRSRKLMRLSDSVKQAVLLQYAGCRNVNVKQHEDLFKKSENADPFGWAGLIISMAGPEIGTIEDVGKMLWNNALVVLSKMDYDRRKAIARGQITSV